MKEENKLDICFVAHFPLPSIEVVFVSGEAINQELVLPTLLHGLYALDNKTCFQYKLHDFLTLASKLHVISTGTMVPLRMWLSISSPKAEPGVFLSSRSKSPADRCTYLNFCTKEYATIRIKYYIQLFITSTILAHCVPFPAPGPPRTKTTFGSSAAILLKFLERKAKPSLPVTQLPL